MQGKNKLVNYDTSDEEDAVVGAQLGCNGVIQILFEPIDFEDLNNPINLLEKAVQGRETMVLVTFFQSQRKKGPSKRNYSHD